MTQEMKKLPKKKLFNPITLQKKNWKMWQTKRNGVSKPALRTTVFFGRCFVSIITPISITLVNFTEGYEGYNVR